MVVCLRTAGGEHVDTREIGPIQAPDVVLLGRRIFLKTSETTGGAYGPPVYVETVAFELVDLRSEYATERPEESGKALDISNYRRTA